MGPMAGRFSFSVPERRNASDPWFRIGEFDVTTTVLVVLPLRGQHVRLGDRPGSPSATSSWSPTPSARPGLADLHLAARQRARHLDRHHDRHLLVLRAGDRGPLGRTRFAVLLAPDRRPGLVGVAARPRHCSASAPSSSAVFLVFIAEYPFVRFFFGIPAWAIGVVFVGLEVLQFLGPPRSDRILLLFLLIATARSPPAAMGLRQSLRGSRRSRCPVRGSGGVANPPQRHGAAALRGGSWTVRGRPAAPPSPPTSCPSRRARRR